jgi:hypothetical protein
VIGRGGCWLLGGDGPIPNLIYTHGPGDVLDLLLAEILEGGIQLVADLVAHDPADADPARLCEGF